MSITQCILVVLAVCCFFVALVKERGERLWGALVVLGFLGIIISSVFWYQFRWHPIPGPSWMVVRLDEEAMVSVALAVNMLFYFLPLAATGFGNFLRRRFSRPSDAEEEYF